MTINETELPSFAAACLRLNFLLGRPPRDVDVALCEDNRTVSMLALDDSGQWVGASYSLDQPTTEEHFDAQRISEAFELKVSR